MTRSFWSLPIAGAASTQGAAPFLMSCAMSCGTSPRQHGCDPGARSKVRSATADEPTRCGNSAVAPELVCPHTGTA